MPKMNRKAGKKNARIPGDGKKSAKATPKRPSTAPLESAFDLEIFEPRLLLSANLATLSAAGTLTLNLSTTAADSLQISHLSANADGSEVVQVTDTISNTTQTFGLEGSGVPLGVKFITVTEGTFADTLDFSAGTLPITASIQITGGTGADTLIGPGKTDNWTINGSGSGTINSNVTFSGQTNLTAATGQTNTFLFTNGGSIAGTVTGNLSDPDKIELEVAGGSVAHTIAFLDSSTTLDGATEFQYTGIGSPNNLILDLSAGERSAHDGNGLDDHD